LGYTYRPRADYSYTEYSQTQAGGAAWAGSTAGSGFNYKPVDHPAYLNSDPNIGDQNPRNNAPPGITLVNIGAPRRMIGVDSNYSF